MDRKLIWGFAAGLVFGVGLVLGGMTQPAKVTAFLNIGGLAQGVSSTAEANKWDPSLAFVMGGALLVSLFAFWWTPKRERPWHDLQFHLPTKTQIDKPLVLGAVLFGAGWGLAGYCPGPAVASIFTGGADALLFVAAMLGGMWLAKRVAPPRSVAALQQPTILDLDQD